ncbi:hypothetical protein CVT25_015171 [Psilocybe cyanescens]|uniref:DUF4218 domain-containing protein n=1 Tax=Psilocybe cyanescens TaxID=93625 RepID=A0A409XAA3_PSICY|nr:hypothetical protein CVT25_015171 [Psilocybe cyanescens]
MKQGGPTRSCRELLVRPTQIGKGRVNTPIKPYIAFSFHDWMANLVSRRSYEEKMDSAWQRMGSHTESGDIEDIFQATRIKEFKGHDKKTHFICICSLTKNSYNDIKYTAWKWRTNDSCQLHAQKYRDAATQNLAESSFDLSGLRSSELLRLPYYDTTKYLLIDPMHNLFLGLIKEHFQNILGCNKIPKEGLPVVNSFAGRLFAHTADNLDTDLFTPTQKASPEIMPASRTSPSLSGRQGYLLTSEDMDEVRRDIQAMVKPSWATSIPTSISSSGPKLKSDQWRAAGSLYLPVTLIRLWSRSGDDIATCERRDLLELTMALFQAVSIISSRTTSARHGKLYLEHMLLYRQELACLFPDYKCHPNHHLALHLGEFLSAYGPVHGWWTFPFERMIGTLQRIHTNYHPGEYEATIAQSWHRRSNLRALLSKIACPPIIVNCAVMFEKFVQPQNQNSLASYATATAQEREVEDQDTGIGNDDIIYQDSLETSVDSDTKKAFMEDYEVLYCPPANVVGRYTQGRVSYNRTSIHDRNSQILVESVPYCIQDILIFRQAVLYDTVWFVVKRLQEAKIKEDPYAHYPYLRAKIWGLETENFTEVIPFSLVNTHYARCVILWEGQDVAICVSLSRVTVV